MQSLEPISTSNLCGFICSCGKEKKNPDKQVLFKQVWHHSKKKKVRQTKSEKKSRSSDITVAVMFYCINPASAHASSHKCTPRLRYDGGPRKTQRHHPVGSSKDNFFDCHKTPVASWEDVMQWRLCTAGGHFGQITNPTTDTQRRGKTQRASSALAAERIPSDVRRAKREPQKNNKKNTTKINRPIRGAAFDLVFNSQHDWRQFKIRSTTFTICCISS